MFINCKSGFLIQCKDLLVHVASKIMKQYSIELFFSQIRRKIRLIFKIFNKNHDEIFFFELFPKTRFLKVFTLEKSIIILKEILIYKWKFWKLYFRIFQDQVCLRQNFGARSRYNIYSRFFFNYNYIIIFNIIFN
jgi:hypothetical protein